MDDPAADPSHDRLTQDFDLLQTAVRDAGALALSYFGREVASTQKADGSPVSEADLAADELLRAALMTDRPDYGWLSEETADEPSRLDARFVWIVDPIDGTRAFLAGTPEWTIAAALVDNGQPVLAAVFNPATAEIFTARRGHGASLNGEAIAVGDRNRIEGCSIIASSGLFSKKIWQEPWPRMQVKWVNSIAYRLALVAQGRAHATIALTPKSEWDLAAATLLVQEAGGRVTGIDASILVFNQPVPRLKGLVAAGPDLHRLLVERTTTVPNSA